MAQITFDCPHCRKSLQIDETAGGMQVKCPECGNAIIVPHASNAPLAGSGSSMRPTSVAVFGILNIVFAGMSLLCTPVGLIFTFVGPNPYGSSPAVKGWMIFSYIAGFACAIWLLTLGIGLLNLKRWARRGSIFYGWFVIVFGIIAMIINLAILRSASLPEGAMPGFIAGTMGGLIGFIYPILLIVFMNRSPAVASCVK